MKLSKSESVSISANNKKIRPFRDNFYLTFSGFNKEIQRNGNSLLLELLGELGKVQGVLDLQVNIRQIVNSRLEKYTQLQILSISAESPTLFESKVV